jgi:hypothetical protein
MRLGEGTQGVPNVSKPESTLWARMFLVLFFMLEIRIRAFAWGHGSNDRAVA